MLALYGICAALHFHGPVAPRHQDVKLQATLEAPPARAPTPATARLNTQDPTLAIPLDLNAKLKVHGPPKHALAARRAAQHPALLGSQLAPVSYTHLTLPTILLV